MILYIKEHKRINNNMHVLYSKGVRKKRREGGKVGEKEGAYLINVIFAFWLFVLRSKEGHN